MDISISNGHEMDQYLLTRVWTLNETLSEEYRVCKNGSALGVDEAADFDKFLFSIIPPELFNLYFFDGILAPLEVAAEHERYVTSLINAIYHECYEARDYRTMKFLDWFVDEQMEEEDNADSMINRYKLFGSDPKGLYALDQEYAGRVYTAPSLVL